MARRPRGVGGMSSGGGERDTLVPQAARPRGRATVTFRPTSTTSLRTVPAREALRAAWRTSLGLHSAVRSSLSSASTTRKPDPTISSKSSVFVSTSNSTSGSGRMVKAATAAIGRTLRDFFRAAPYWRARARSHISTVSGTSPPGPQHRAAGYARQTTPAVADSASGRASVPTRRTDVPRGAAPGRTATA